MEYEYNVCVGDLQLSTFLSVIKRVIKRKEMSNKKGCVNTLWYEIMCIVHFIMSLLFTII